LDFVNVPEEYSTEYDEELQDSGYTAAEEFTYPEFPKYNSPEQQDISYLVAEKAVKSRTYNKYRETFPSRTQLFKHIYSNTCEDYTKQL
jgi:hypothetical protein